MREIQLARFLIATLTIVALAASPVSATAPFVMALGDLPGGPLNSSAAGISPDAHYVTGYGNSATAHQAFVWTLADGMVGIGGLPGVTDNSDGADVSNTGVVVGGSAGPFRWTSVDGMSNLGSLPGMSTSDGNALDVSGDGSLIVGQSGSRAFRWTQPQGML